MRGSWIAARLAESGELLRRIAWDQSPIIERAGQVIATALVDGHKLVLFGNGGSAADAQHIAAEFVGRFLRERDPLPALSLATDSSVLTCIGNDFGFDQIFARQLKALGRRGDVVVAISTSGDSPNVIAAIETARAGGMKTIGLTSAGGGRLAEMVEIPIVVPSSSIPRIQEGHIAIGHVLCETVEELLAARSVEDSTQAGWTERDEAGVNMAWDWNGLIQRRECWRDQGLSVVWTNGCFDMLHVGHIRSLQAARRLGDRLVVGINSDDSVQVLKGSGRPIFPAVERTELLAALHCVDAVILFDEPTPEEAISRLRPDIHCKGADYAPPHGKPVPESRAVEAYGGRVEFLPPSHPVTTSGIIEHIRELELVAE